MSNVNLLALHPADAATDGYMTKEHADLLNTLRNTIGTKASQAALDVEKARIDNLTSLPEGATTNDAVLQDIAVGADGITYDSPGEAVREQINKITNCVTHLQNTEYDTISEESTFIEYTDISDVNIYPDGHAYVGSKNFLVVDDFSETKNGVTCTVNNGVFNVTGTSTAAAGFLIPFEMEILAGESYTWQMYVTDGNESIISCNLFTDQWGTKATNSGISVSNGAYARQVINDTGLIDCTTEYFRVYVPTEKEFSHTFKLLLTLGTHEELEYEYSALPQKIENQMNIPYAEYLCVQSYDAFTIEHYVPRAVSYTAIIQKPTINGIEISGDKTTNDYNIVPYFDNKTEIRCKYKLFPEDFESITIGELTYASTITNGTLYPALIDDEANGVINPIFRYSSPMRIPVNTFPANKSVNQGDGRKEGYCIEFYVDDIFEIKFYNNISTTIIVDDVQICDQYNAVTTDQALSTCFIKVDVESGVRHHIKLYMGGNIKFFGIVSTGTVTKYEENRMLMIADGDSIVEGATIGSSLGMYRSIMGVVANMLNMDFIDVGIGGSGYVKTGNGGQPNMVDRFETNITPYNPDLLVVMAGLNDISQDFATITANIDQYWEKAIALSPKYLIMVSPYSPRPTSELNQNVKNIADYLKIVALEYNIPYIDIVNGYTYDAMGNIISQNPSECIITDDNQQTFYSEYYAGTSLDRTHPNVAGHLYIGKYIGNEIFKLCKDGYGLA